MYLCGMYLFNITIIVEDAIAENFLQWLNEVQLPAIMETSNFVSNRLLQVVDSPNEGATYSLQLIAETIDDYQKFKDMHEQALIGAMYSKFTNQLVTFSTLMKFIA